MMRRHFAYTAVLALLLTVALAACRREPLLIPGDAIRFSVDPTVSVSSALTKAGDDPTTEDYLVAHGNAIRVWGDYTTNGGTSWTSPFPGTDITCAWAVGGTPSWNYTPVQSWVDNATYRFRAVFPTTADIQTTGTNKTGGDKLVVQYTLPGENYDLMVASAPSVPSTDQIGNTLPLSFRHACAAVRFLFQENDPKTEVLYYIKEFQLLNLYTQGTLTYTGNSASAGVTTAEWHYDAARTTVYTWSDGGDDANRWAVPAEKENFDAFPTGYKWFFMIPQPLSVNDGKTPSVYIKYQAGTGVIESTIPLPETDSFVAGNKYTYVINLIPKETGITLSVEPWDVINVPVDDIIFGE